MQKQSTSRNPVISVRLSDLTRKQIDELTAKWGCSMADVITILIDRTYQQEINTMPRLVNQERPVHPKPDYDSAGDLDGSETVESLVAEWREYDAQ